ncbi:heavy-metal-associated domain-containing protein [Acidipila rosea]|uniref:Copper chaperone n=1 Tax=Acidipila rosea TaxID=768535 RepID=A0A4R1L7B1_9BACT|nr:heavy-metal-associated domain-containing protein [Acidipila rosea]MBW4043773.1 heavy-metal-associated domain-containing protein [Acidobacteriota bacterium]TCK74074.1 copper chaperone [Acidipila rosea]
MSEVTLKIDGMHCGACVRRVTQTLEKLDGVKVEDVTVGAARVEASDPASATPAILAALQKAGYPAHAEN